MGDAPLTLDDLQKATGPVGEPDDAPIGTSVPDPKQGHPYGDDKYGKGSGAVLKQLGANKVIKPGTGQ